jgi:hypothetical protein
MRAARQKSGSPLASERGGDLLHVKRHAVAVRTGLMSEESCSAPVFHIDRDGSCRGGDRGLLAAGHELGRVRRRISNQSSARQHAIRR